MGGQHSAFFQWTLVTLCLQWSWAGWDSILVKPGICPQNLYSCFGRSETICKHDGDCKESLKCCSYRCKRSCAAPVLEKIGQCPADVSLCRKRNRNECEQDFDCNGEQKCCRTKCGAKCKMPPESKSGACPAPTSLCSPLSDISPPKCSSDGDCPAKKKCCTIRCGQECLELKQPDKPGRCPPHNGTEPCQQSLGKDKCYSDGNCPGQKKCCGHCLKKCSNPQRKYSIELDGIIEIIDPDAVAEPEFE